MRNLTIKRIKSFVASLSKMRVYIEDPMSSETTINNVACRKIGTLKNGEEKTFQIGEQAAKVFVIADGLSKGFCNEFYQLPEGNEDIILTGKNRYNPARGNAFKFDNNENAEVLENRKKGTRIGVIILLVAIIVGAVGGFLISSGTFAEEYTDPKTFSVDGMTITLTDEFKESDVDGYAVVYESQKAAVFVLKEKFPYKEGFEDYTLEQYAALVISTNNYGNPEIKTVDGLTFFEYTFKDGDHTYIYFSYVYKNTDSFWVVQFVVRDNAAEKFAPKIAEWAKSVEFSN